MEGNRTKVTDTDVVVSAKAALDSLQHIMATVTDSKSKFDRVPLGLPIMFGILKTVEINTNKAIQIAVDAASPEAKKELQSMQQQAKDYFSSTLNNFGWEFAGFIKTHKELFCLEIVLVYSALMCSTSDDS